MLMEGRSQSYDAQYIKEEENMSDENLNDQPRKSNSWNHVEQG